jgi:hypothetical protein
MIGRSKVPSILYKYRDWGDEKHRRILTGNEIFFSSAKHFNDPFDCQLNIRWDLITDNQAINRIEQRIREENPTLANVDVKSIAEGIQQLYNYKDVENLRYLDLETKRYLAEEHGILGLCETSEDIIMWSHYSNCHRGFCVAFDKKKLENFFEQKNIPIGPYRVSYEPNYPIVKFINDDNNVNNISMEILTKKSDRWSYENEWRYILFGATDYSLSLPDGIIIRIILGCNIGECHKSEIIQILKSKNCKIDLFQAEKMPYSYGLKFEKLKY